MTRVGSQRHKKKRQYSVDSYRSLTSLMCAVLVRLRDMISEFLLLARYSNCKGKGHPCTGTEALYRPYGPQGE